MKRMAFVISCLIIFFIGIIIARHQIILAVDCDPSKPLPSDQNQLQDLISSCGDKLNGIHNQESSLSSQIAYMDTQIYLTTVKIQQTEEQITQTQSEIDLLSSRIDNLDSSLNHLTSLFIDKIVDGYKKREVSFFNVLLDSTNAFDFLNRIKYLKAAQDSNQKLVVQVQETKSNFEDQKKLREEKKTKTE